MKHFCFCIFSVQESRNQLWTVIGPVYRRVIYGCELSYWRQAW